MSRTTRKCPGWLNWLNENIILRIQRGHANIGKDIQYYTEAGRPKAKKLRKRILTRKQRHQGKDFSEWS